MSSSEADASSGQPPISKKAAKKEAAKQEKQRRRIDDLNLSSASQAQEHDPLSAYYDDVPLLELQSKLEVDFPYTQVEGLTEELKDKRVMVRGRAQTIHAVGKKMAFVVVREKGFTVQSVVTEQPDVVSRQMVKFIATLSRESVIDVEGIISVPAEPIKGASHKVEIQIRKLYCISRALTPLPINLEDAARSETEIENALKAGEQLVYINLG